MTLLALLLLLTVPQGYVNTGLVEVNTFGCETNPNPPTQVIFWRDGHVYDWRWDYQVPVPHRYGWVRFEWLEGKRVYRFEGRIEYTRTIHDPEVDDREHLPEEWRERLK